LIHLEKRQLEKIIDQAKKAKILVFGDLMVDEYLWGNVTRISPEAPVPIINISSAQSRFGGAANVAFNLQGLGQTPLLVGVVGEDRMGQLFRNMMEENNLPGEGIITVPQRPTTVKTRIIGNNQQIARVDQETTEPVSLEVQERLFKIFVSQIESVSAIIIQDYNKGIVVPQLVNHIIDLANRNGKIIAVDPKFENFFSFKNVTLFKPNIKEAEEALAMRINNEQEVVTAGKKLMSALNCEAILITRGAHGMALLEKNGDCTFVETKARKVADVSGAGDTVIATLSYALSGGASMKEAVTMANFAAGLVCEEVGVVPVNLNGLQNSILQYRDDRQ
jgi:D-glycero-beta-D-manno-heptose-7-phosphate kinase